MPRSRDGAGDQRWRKIAARGECSLHVDDQSKPVRPLHMKLGEQYFGFHRSRSTQDVVQPLDELHCRNVRVLAQTGVSFGLSTASGKLMPSIMAGLAEFAHGSVRSPKSGMVRAKAAVERDGYLTNGSVRRSIGRKAGEHPSKQAHEEWRLFVYHCQAEPGSHTSQTFKVCRSQAPPFHCAILEFVAIKNPPYQSRPSRSGPQALHTPRPRSCLCHFRPIRSGRHGRQLIQTVKG